MKKRRAGNDTGGCAGCTPRLGPLPALVQRMRAALFKDRSRCSAPGRAARCCPCSPASCRAPPDRFEACAASASSWAARSSRPISVAEVLDHNPQYWRAMTEMRPATWCRRRASSFTSPTASSMWVRLYPKPVYYFSKTDNLAHDYIELFKELIIIFQADLEERINPAASSSRPRHV